MRDRVLVHKGVDIVSRDAGFQMLTDHEQRVGGQLAGLAHSHEHGRGHDFDRSQGAPPANL
jgi:hypothetical protein